MSWTIWEERGVALVRMQSNAVNKQNDAFFADLQAAFDRLETEFRGRPVVLTGQGAVFSAGLDFGHAFAIFARSDPDEISAWYRRFSDAILRVFTYPQPTVAAINGHAIAGGLILALGCDHRVAARGAALAGLNEVAVGIPMPSLYTELVRSRIGSARTFDAILSGRLYTVDEATTLGLYHEAAPPDGLLELARTRAHAIPASCLAAYAHSKKMLLAPTLAYIADWSRALDRETEALIGSAAVRAAQTEAYERLKAR